MRVIHHGHLGGDAGRPLQVAGPELGTPAFAVAVEQVGAGDAAAPLPCAGGEGVAIVLTGCGKLVVDGAPQRFQAPCTLVLPPGAECRVVNHGAVAMQLVWVWTPELFQETEK